MSYPTTGASLVGLAFTLAVVACSRASSPTETAPAPVASSSPAAPPAATASAPPPATASAAASAGVAASGAVAPAPTNAFPGEPPEPKLDEPLPKTLDSQGFHRRNVEQEPIKEAAGKALELLKQKQQDPSMTLTSILYAGTAPVAGLKYRFTLAVQTAKGPKTVDLVMFRDLKAQHSLTSVSGL
jgi:hypothetical protein